MNEVNKTVKKLKTARTLIVVVYAIVVFAITLFTIIGVSLETDPEVMDQTFTGFVVVMVALMAVYLFALTFLGLRVDRILLNECDPVKYYGVFNGFSKSKRTPKYLVTQVSLMTSTFSGDFRAAMDSAEELMESKKPILRLLGYSHYLNAAYYLTEMELFNRFLEDFKSMEKLSRSRRYIATYKEVLNDSLRLKALAEGDVEKALQYLEKAQSKFINNIQKAQYEYNKGETYFAAGEKEKAVEAFMKTKEICGKTYYGRFADMYLEKLN